LGFDSLFSHHLLGLAPQRRYPWRSLSFLPNGLFPPLSRSLLGVIRAPFVFGSLPRTKQLLSEHQKASVAPELVHMGVLMEIRISVLHCLHGRPEDALAQSKG
jgi:hypothetical protein